MLLSEKPCDLLVECKLQISGIPWFSISRDWSFFKQSLANSNNGSGRGLGKTSWKFSSSLRNQGLANCSFRERVYVMERSHMCQANHQA